MPPGQMFFPLPGPPLTPAPARATILAWPPPIPREPDAGWSSPRRWSASSPSAWASF